MVFLISILCFQPFTNHYASMTFCRRSRRVTSIFKPLSMRKSLPIDRDDRPIAVRQAQCEVQIFTYLTLGYALKTIVKTLGISPHTEWSIERNVLTYELYV